MQRDDTIRTLHILDAARKALHFVENRTRHDLDNDEMLAISLVHLLRPLKNAPFCPSSVSDSNFNPRNTKCIPVVKIIVFLDLGQN